MRRVAYEAKLVTEPSGAVALMRMPVLERHPLYRVTNRQKRGPENRR
jgi:hypothetical protein